MTIYFAKAQLSLICETRSQYFYKVHEIKAWFLELLSLPPQDTGLVHWREIENKTWQSNFRRRLVCSFAVCIVAGP